MRFLFQIIFLLLAADCIANLDDGARSAAHNYGEEAEIDCKAEAGGGGGFCRLDMGDYQLKLPAVVRFRTAANSYMSLTPPVGGSIKLSDQPRDWEVWRVEEVGDKVAFRSVHGTYLSEKWAPCDGFELTGERLDHELFVLEDKWNGKVAIRCYNGLYISAYPSGTQWPEGIRQMPFPPKAHEWSDDAWEVWTVEQVSEGHVALRSAHGTYLGSTPPERRGSVSQSSNAGAWEAVILDSIDRQHLVMQDPWHGTFVSMSESDGVVELSDSPGAYQRWRPFVNRSSGTMCLQSKSGEFLRPGSGGDRGWRASSGCGEEELLEPSKV